MVGANRSRPGFTLWPFSPSDTSLAVPLFLFLDIPIYLERRLAFLLRFTVIYRYD